MIKKLAMIAAVPAVAVALSSQAHADQTTDYLQCLNRNGLYAIDTVRVLDAERRIDLDEILGVPRSTTVANLEYYWGASPYQAMVEVDCAWSTAGDL